jgi:hypothetical protein
VRWESLVGRIVVILAVGVFFGWLGSALWSPNGPPPPFRPCSPHQVCVGADGDQAIISPPHLAIILVLAGVWLLFGVLVIRNRDG